MSDIRIARRECVLGITASKTTLIIKTTISITSSVDKWRIWSILWSESILSFYVKILKIYRELINRYTSLKLKDFRFLISEVLYCTEVCVLVLTYFCLFPSSRGWVDVFAGSSGVSSSLVMSSSVVTPSWVSSCSRLRFCHRTCTQELTRCSFYTLWTLADNLNLKISHLAA